MTAIIHLLVYLVTNYSKFVSHKEKIVDSKHFFINFAHGKMERFIEQYLRCQPSVT